jgi:hypothetical protein
MRRLLCAGLLLGLFGLPRLGVALAGAAAEMTRDLRRIELPAGPPAPLLGPIGEEGRSGWRCRPERAAQSPRAGEAELPDESR